MSRNPQPLSQIVTQAVQQMVVNRPLKLKKGARVARLSIQETSDAKSRSYPLVGDRWIIGRSSQSCDIILKNPIVSKVHCSIHRNQKNIHQFEIRDENSNNGLYFGNKKIKSLVLKAGDVVSLGPPELADTPLITFDYPSHRWLKGLRYGLFAVGGIFALFIGAIALESSKVTVKPLPPGVVGPVVMYAEDGKTPLNPVKQETHHELDNLNDFSPYLPKAVMASEDSRFYWHLGVDPVGIIRAIAVNSQGKNKQGASTLTQQLARSLFPEVGRENTAGRKWREMAVAIKLNFTYSKNDILKIYLNRVYLGSGHYGFEDAAQFYFDKSAQDLDISEAATLVGMLPAPNLYNPIEDYDTAIQMRDRVIRRMAELGMITEQEANRARRSRLQVSPKAHQSLSKLIAPYFYSYVFTELRQLLGDEVANEGNFIVETSLNPGMQNQAEKSLNQNINQLGSRFNYSQGALVTLNSRNGEILAMVGGKDYQKSQYNRATQAQRQPGSTFKLFTYTAAIAQGISPNQLFSCNPLQWQGQVFKACERSTGEIPLTQGLARSENAVALRVAQQVGLDSIIHLARRFGIHSKLISAPGLVLGESETTVLEMTAAYAAIANQGIWNKPHAIRRILDGGDCQNYEQPQTCREIYNFEGEQNRQQSVVSANIAATMMMMLRQTVSQGTGQSANSIPNAAGKTGTTNKGVDLWFMGIIPQNHLVTGVWLGNDDNRPTSGSSAQAVNLWTIYSQKLLGL